MVLCQGVTFALDAGDICHLIGKNGLGKTTLLMQIAGILPIVEGSLDYQNQPLAKGAIYVLHQTGIHENLSVQQNLRFLLSLYGVSPNKHRLNEALAAVGLYGFDEVKVGELSAGQARRVGLARLWLMEPNHAPLWVLDEPFTALDVAMIKTLSSRLRQFAQAGGAVLLTSHQSVHCANKVVDLATFVGEFGEMDGYGDD